MKLSQWLSGQSKPQKRLLAKQQSLLRLYSSGEVRQWRMAFPTRRCGRDHAAVWSSCVRSGSRSGGRRVCKSTRKSSYVRPQMIGEVIDSQEFRDFDPVILVDFVRQSHSAPSRAAW